MRFNLTYLHMQQYPPLDMPARETEGKNVNHNN